MKELMNVIRPSTDKMTMRVWIFSLISMLLILLSINVVKAADEITYYHNDISGTPILSTNAAGEVLWKESYRPYGDKLTKQAASKSNQIGFHGKPFDDDTGLSYMQARYYDPILGRFTGIDPVGYQVDNLHSFNRYAYANNNPYKYVDPDGRNAVTKFVKQSIKHDGNIIEAAYDVGGDLYTVFAPASTPISRIEAAISLVSPIDVSDVKAAKAAYNNIVNGGRKGGAATRALNEVVGKNINAKGGKVTAGLGEKETYFPSGNGAKGGRYSDGTAKDAQGNSFQIQTVDTKANGNLTNREAQAAKTIAERSNQPVVCISKISC